jgi:leader peptidase (prepilin peptidase)/N-methyltransferase
MFLIWPILALLGIGFFLVGTVVGSFLNVCIYRIPWQKSVVWPGSQCPHCYGAIVARDNVPIVSWIALRGECRGCGNSISARYPLVESLVGFLFLGSFLVDVIMGPRGDFGQVPATQLIAATYHALFLSLLVAATFIDYDWYEIPKEITDAGMVVGLALGAIWPSVRPDPVGGLRFTHWEGFWAGLIGLLVGAGLTQAVRLPASFAFRREAMGFGDVTLMGMIGAFMGWQAAVLTFFIGPFFAIGHALWKFLRIMEKRLSGRQSAAADHEIPYGP